MPVELLTDEQAAAYAAFRGAPSRTELERFFFLDDADRELIEGKRRTHNRLGFAVQLTTARYLGVFLDDPTDVPAEVVDYLAEQLDIVDASVLKAYGERENTRLEHVRELRRVLEYRDPRRPGHRRVQGQSRRAPEGHRRRHAHLRRRPQGQRCPRPRDREEADHQDREERGQAPLGGLALPGTRGRQAAAVDDGLPLRPKPVRIRRPEDPLTAEEIELRERLQCQPHPNAESRS